MNKWLEEEIEILKENYYKGSEYTSKLIERHSRESIKLKANKLDLFVDEFLLYNDLDEVKRVISECFSLSQVFKKMNRAGSGESYKVFKKAIERYNIDISHFDKNKNKIKNFTKINIDEILMKNSTYDTTSLKERLYKEGLKDRECEMCGQDEEWNGKKMSLILDHINGIRNDHRIENLRILCPNCNSTLDTHCKGNTKHKKKKYYCECGNIKTKNSKHCKVCSDKKQRRVERPNKEVLIKEIEKSSYVAVGKKYGVSDNAIRKWLK
jgi:hypothetical protein